MKLKSSWNLAGWNLLNSINLRKRGEIQPKKISMFKQNLDFQKNLPLVVGEDSWTHGRNSPLFGILESIPPSGPAHMAVPADSTTGTFQRSKNGRFFFDRKKSQVASAL